MKFYSIIPMIILLYAGCWHKKNDARQHTQNTIYRDEQVTDFFRRTQGAIAMDGGFSIPLSNHKVLWLFGDTYIDHYDSTTGTVPCLFNVRNSALLQPLNNWQWRQTRTLLSNGPGLKNFLKNSTNSNHFIWPSSGIQLGDTVYVYCNRMKNIKKKGGLGFGSNGPPVWAKLTLPDMKVVSFSPLPDFGKVAFGTRFIKDEKNGYVYVYGSHGLTGTFTNEIVLARFPINSPEHNWTYWDGKEWTTRISNIASIDSVPAFSWDICKVKNKYLLLYAAFSLGCDQGKEIYAAVSDNMTGPFSKAKSIYTIPDTVQGHHPFFYGVIAHPEYMNKKNELLVTYCINGYSPCIANCVNNRFNPDYYRLRAIRVPLESLDSDL